MSGSGPVREQEGEIEFSSDELVEMKVEVAGREDGGAAARRKKRALRVPADEVPRTANATLTTEPDLEAIAASANDEGDAVVDHAFDNGETAEGEVKAAPNFVAAEAAAPDGGSAEGDTDEASATPTKSRAEMRDAISRLPPNLRALVRAVAPPTVAEKIDTGEVEQLDSSELEVMDGKEGGDPTSAAPAVDGEAVHEVSADEVSDGDVSEDDELTLDADEASAEPAPRERTRTLPPAMPAAAATPPRPRPEVPANAASAQPLIAPATVPLQPPPPPGAEAEPALRPRRRRRAKQWFEEIFDDDYLRTLPYLSAKQTEREAAFIAESLEVPAGGSLLDVGCGYGRHAMELAGRGHQVTGLDLSLPLLIRAADAARRVGVAVNFVHGDMREMTFDAEFDGAYCAFTSFGYFDDDTNRKVAANLQKALKPGGKVLIDLVNRDYITRDLPTRVWWQGDGCVVLEEVDFNYFSSRLQVQRSIIFEDGRQLEQEISIRAYSLHEIGKVLHHAGFRVIEVSGGLGLRGKFFGAHSRQLLVLAEKKPQP